jgi:hypothetical protein
VNCLKNADLKNNKEIMTPHEMLADWLAKKEKEYKKGVEIYTSLGIDIAKVKYFNSAAAGRMHMGILVRELDNYARKNSIKPKIYEAKKSVFINTVNPATANETKHHKTTGIERPRIDRNPFVRREELPVNLQVLFDLNGKLTGEMKTFHAELKACGDGDDMQQRRAELAKMLVDAQNETRKNWDTIDTWWNDRKGKTPEELAAEQAIEKQNRITANLNYIRRYMLSKKPAQIAELEKRKTELDTWGVSYEKLIAKVAISGEPEN